jgi:hypothetical protein
MSILKENVNCFVTFLAPNCNLSLPGQPAQSLHRATPRGVGKWACHTVKSRAAKDEKGPELQPAYSQKARLNLLLLHDGRDGWLPDRP